MELTKEHFDKVVAGLATKDDMAALETHVDEQIEQLAGMVQRGFADITERLDVRERLEKTERQVEEIQRTLKLA